MTRTETDDAVVFSIDFTTASASAELSVNLTLVNNYASQSVPMTIIGGLTRTISWTCRTKGMAQVRQMPPLTITQYVKPAMSPKAPRAHMVAGHFILHGIDPTLAVDAGKSESVESGLYISGLRLAPLIYRAGNARTPTITVSGKSTITAQLSYVDASGAERVVPLENLSRQYRNNQDVFAKSDFPQTLSELKAKEGDLVPTGYSLKAIEIIGDTTAQYPGGYPAGTAQWDTTARYNYNGSVVRYELQPAGTTSVMPITGADGFWNVFTLSALLAGMTLVPGWYAFSGLRRRHER